MGKPKMGIPNMGTLGVSNTGILDLIADTEAMHVGGRSGRQDDGAAARSFRRHI